MRYWWCLGIVNLVCATLLLVFSAGSWFAGNELAAIYKMVLATFCAVFYGVASFKAYEERGR